MTLILHPEARDEMIESARYYSRQVPGLGQDFLQAIDLAFDEISEAPDRWSRFRWTSAVTSCLGFPLASISNSPRPGAGDCDGSL